MLQLQDWHRIKHIFDLEDALVLISGLVDELLDFPPKPAWKGFWKALIKTAACY